MAIAGYGNILITMSLKGDCKLGELLCNPAYDGFRMPAEFEQHHGCIMIWPKDLGRGHMKQERRERHFVP